MLKNIKRIKSEKGSATIEFLGMVPYVLLMMLMLWQFLVGAYALITVQSAANEAAKVYAMTGVSSEAQQASQRIVGSLKNTVVQHNHIVDQGGRQFTASVKINLSLAFLPKKFIGMNVPTVPITQTVEGRKI